MYLSVKLELSKLCNYMYNRYDSILNLFVVAASLLDFHPLHQTPSSPMSFWKPGEAYPDKSRAEEMDMEETIPLSKPSDSHSSEKVQLSETTRNLPVRC